MKGKTANKVHVEYVVLRAADVLKSLQALSGEESNPPAEKGGNNSATKAGSKKTSSKKPVKS